LLKRITEILKTFIKYQVALVEVRRFKFLKLFLIGAYGEVRKCLHKETKALRAVKIINKKYLAEEEKAKLMNEIDILK
jgi:serine/threonine protein kinase